VTDTEEEEATVAVNAAVESNWMANEYNFMMLSVIVCITNEVLVVAVVEMNEQERSKKIGEAARKAREILEKRHVSDAQRAPHSYIILSPQRSWREDSRRCCKVYYFDYHYLSK
jgi:hypothetical protein